MHARIKQVSWYPDWIATLGAGVLLLAVWTPGPLLAAEAGTSLAISVSVVSNSVLTTLYQARELEISQRDIAQGYVDARSASRFALRTNSRKGYVMTFDPALDVFDAVEVRGLSTQALLGRDGGEMVQRGNFPAAIEQDLSFRFYLMSDANPGRYAWPLRLSVRALE